MTGPVRYFEATQTLISDIILRAVIQNVMI